MTVAPSRLCIVLGIVLLRTATSATSSQRQENPLPFACAVFARTIGVADIAARFGAGNVKAALVPWGGAEGDRTEGSVLFDGIEDARLEIHWRDATNKRNPDWVHVNGTRTRWRTPAGISLGTSLRELERANGGPFRLLGFGSDVQGTILPWQSERLDGATVDGCRVRIRLAPDWRTTDQKARLLMNQLKGEREYSSGHPAMQELNPTVSELFLQYDYRQ
jgi:hypothetical protein